MPQVVKCKTFDAGAAERRSPSLLKIAQSFFRFLIVKQIVVRRGFRQILKNLPGETRYGNFPGSVLFDFMMDTARLV